jgi:hypothetical protein
MIIILLVEPQPTSPNLNSTTIQAQLFLSQKSLKKERISDPSLFKSAIDQPE